LLELTKSMLKFYIQRITRQKIVPYAHSRKNISTMIK
jgi:hypothetical protein